MKLPSILAIAVLSLVIGSTVLVSKGGTASPYKPDPKINAITQDYG